MRLVPSAIAPMATARIVWLLELGMATVPFRLDRCTMSLMMPLRFASILPCPALLGVYAWEAA